jgi:hypothetical protein
VYLIDSFKNEHGNNEDEVLPTSLTEAATATPPPEFIHHPYFGAKAPQTAFPTHASAIKKEEMRSKRMRG